MKRFALLALVVLLSAATLALAPASPATSGQAVTINSQIQTGPFTGTWTATGAIADSGTLIEPNVIFVGNGQLHIERVFTGAQGTITIRIESTLTGVVGDTGTFNGHWVVVSGTGAYINLHGQGLRAATIDLNTGIVTETLTGDAHFD
jgi:uncharacterized protein YdeI (BOF family)